MEEVCYTLFKWWFCKVWRAKVEEIGPLKRWEAQEKGTRLRWEDWCCFQCDQKKYDDVSVSCFSLFYKAIQIILCSQWLFCCLYPNYFYYKYLGDSLWFKTVTIQKSVFISCIFNQSICDQLPKPDLYHPPSCAHWPLSPIVAWTPVSSLALHLGKWKAKSLPAIMTALTRPPARPGRPDQFELNSWLMPVQKDPAVTSRMTDNYLYLILMLTSPPQEGCKPHLQNTQKISRRGCARGLSGKTLWNISELKMGRFTTDGWHKKVSILKKKKKQHCDISVTIGVNVVGEVKPEIIW